MGWVALVCVCACTDPDAGPEAPFPAEYAASYVEVRDCRRSGDHDLHYIRILADGAAASRYLQRDRPFDDGAVVLKEEYDFSDGACAGDVVQWTVMVGLAPGSSPETLDWRWYQVDRDRIIVTEDAPRCYGCHASCAASGVGYLGTCADP